MRAEAMVRDFEAENIEPEEALNLTNLTMAQQWLFNRTSAARLSSPKPARA